MQQSEKNKIGEERLLVLRARLQNVTESYGIYGTIVEGKEILLFYWVTTKSGGVPEKENRFCTVIL